MNYTIRSNPSEGVNLPFPLYIRRLFNVFAFFLAYPFVYIFGNSLSFYIFFLILFTLLNQHLSHTGPVSRYSFLFIWFLFAAAISLIFAPEFDRHPGLVADIQIMVQYIYWVILALTMAKYGRRIDMYSFSKWLTFGMLASLFFFFFLPLKFDTEFLDLRFIQTRNFLVFNLLSITPISFYYITKRFRVNGIRIFGGIVFIFMLMTTGRAGSVLIIVELFLVGMIFFQQFRKIARFAFFFGILLFIAIQNINFQPLANQFSDVVEPLNPRFAKMIRGQGEGELSLSEDKSWLLRQLMIDKSIEIFKEYPVSGVGINHFGYYDSKLSSLNEYDRLRSGSEEFYNSRAAHNSYFQLLAELGLFGIIPFTMIILIPNVFFLRRLFFGQLGYTMLPMISLFAISIYFYAISSITGAISWFVIGFAFYSMKLNRKT